MKILNLYSGLGGNRELWGNHHEITAVEIEEKIAKKYKKKFPKDKIIIGDAHEYLLKHYKEFDFIWSSPPCPTHSVTNHFLNAQGIIRYPDMSLYQEVIFLKHFFKGKWVVENVKPYYDPLIKPQYCGRHIIFCNFIITPLNNLKKDIGTFNRSASKIKQKLAESNKNKRDMVNPEIGQHIFNCAFKIKQKELF